MDALSGRIRFNEAEAFTPRIVITTLLLRMLQKRFNEAEAFTPRIEIARSRGLTGSPGLQ